MGHSSLRDYYYKLCTSFKNTVFLEPYLFSPSEDTEVYNRPVAHLLINHGIKSPPCPQKNGFFLDPKSGTLDFDLMRKFFTFCYLLLFVS